MVKTNPGWLAFILVLTAFCAWVALPATTKGVTLDDPICIEYARDPETYTGDVRCTESVIIDTDSDGVPEFSLPINQRLGLDLVGGLRVLLQADLPEGSFTQQDLNETSNNVGRRVNGLGLTEATIQVQGSSRILVELPGVRDRQTAVDTIQQTALLEFVDFGGLSSQAQGLVGQRILTTEQARLNSLRDSAEPAAEATADPSAPAPAPRVSHPTTGQPFETIITGACLQAASAQYAQTSQAAIPQWYIAFEIKPGDECATAFARFTGSRIGEPMAIVMDGEVLSAPRIQAELSDGGIIEGDFTDDEANTLALQLRSGALAVPLRVLSVEEVGATLGQESVALSLKAGVIGVIVVFIFMLVYYRVPGIAADLALGVFIILNLALFKLIPVTLTLPAITGFLISIGTAVDGNILIFERIKEELRAGKRLEDALILGFDRAWTSIRDSNFSTIIICAILFVFGQTPGASVVSGFAVTLALGLFVNLFTAVLVTRTFLALLVRLGYNAIAARPWLMGV